MAITENEKPVTGKDSLYSSAVIDKKKAELIIKIVNISSASQEIELNLTGIKLAKTDAVSQILAGNDLYSYNKLSELDKLKPEEKKFIIKTNRFNQHLPAYSVTVLKIPFTNK